MSDGGETVRRLQEYLHPCSEHVIDWFHVTMRLTERKVSFIFDYYGSQVPGSAKNTRPANPRFFLGWRHPLFPEALVPAWYGIHD